jgi:conjugative transfer signal peptidase TraF
MTALRRRYAIVGLGLALPMTLLAAGFLGGLRVNLTPSYPLGLWRLVPLDRAVAVGDLIFICPPQAPAFEIARERGYVRHGLCPSWSSPLIKTVAALAGAHVEIAESVIIDGRAAPHSSPRMVDAEGRALGAWSGGVVPAGTIFLLSQYAGSYDSRYFGPIPVAGLLGLAQPVLTVAP